jgi:hypothetical protein
MSALNSEENLQLFSSIPLIFLEEKGDLMF